MAVGSRCRLAALQFFGTQRAQATARSRITAALSSAEAAACYCSLTLQLRVPPQLLATRAPEAMELPFSLRWTQLGEQPASNFPATANSKSASTTLQV